MAPGARDALRPLWFLTAGAATGATLAMIAATPAGVVSGWSLIGLGTACLLAALVRLPRRGALALLLLAGAAAMLGRGLVVRSGDHAVATLPATAAVRISADITTGWRASRWGSRTTVRIGAAHLAGRPLRLPRTAQLEIRGRHSRWQLPPPGATVEGLVAVRPTATGTLLIASSSVVLRIAAPPHGVAAWRDRLSRGLVTAAGTDVDRIRAAELAAAVALGRRDLLPAERRAAWRSSGLAHVLAVSGLHVGLVGAMVWFAAVLGGLRPGPTRAVTAIAIVAYAVLAGASPSAMRAAAMGVVILAARSLGRSVLPLGAVLVAALVVLATDPTLIADAGFQLTVVITAALVRWVPPLVEQLPLPRFVAATVAVPVVAQLAAAPIVMWHFRTAAVGAVLTNLWVPLLVTPTLAAALAATALAPLWAGAATLLLDLVAVAERLLWVCGAAARASATITPALPPALAAILVAAGWLALQRNRRAWLGAVAWTVATAAAFVAWPWATRPAGIGLELLTVADGLAAIAWTPAASVVFDGGRSPEETVRQLRDRGWRRVDAVLASHTDDDHIGGLTAVVTLLHPRELIVPTWLVRDPTAAALLRAARVAGVRVRPVARGSVVAAGGLRLDVLWPPARGASAAENERSLVVRVADAGGAGTMLLTADIGRDTERRLARTSRLACDVLLIPHHGSRFSSSPELLAAAAPTVALIPAGPFNLHGHPASAVLERLEARGIPYRAPIFDGPCGARHTPTGWELFPSLTEQSIQQISHELGPQSRDDR